MQILVRCNGTRNLKIEISKFELGIFAFFLSCRPNLLAIFPEELPLPSPKRKEIFFVPRNIIHSVTNPSFS